MSIRHEQKEQRKAVILKSALDLFIRKGYGETKVADIANAADMSMGLLFHYFDSKEKLYEELIRIGCERLKMDFHFADESPLETFNKVVEELFTMICTNPSAAKMFVLMENAQHLENLPEDLKRMLAEADKLIKRSIPLIEKGQLLGEIKEGNAEALAVTFWCSIQGIAQYIALHPETPCPDTKWILSILENKEVD
ncbi:TetR/AcrR family transcriptional regulator [Lysinibacillus sp. NPDC047702]|uniref:TetR/AcrR family transcriptional regulator n=1 Tax=unclassified Lysinibacillus TaxID=2636778 RepID=UPI003D07EFA3